MTYEYLEIESLLNHDISGYQIVYKAPGEEWDYLYKCAKQDLLAVQQNLLRQESTPELQWFIASIKAILMDADHDFPYQDIDGRPTLKEVIVTRHSMGGKPVNESFFILNKRYKTNITMFDIDTVQDATFEVETVDYAKVLKRTALLIDDSLKTENKFDITTRKNHLYSMIADINNVKNTRKEYQGSMRYFHFKVSNAALNFAQHELNQINLHDNDVTSTCSVM